MGEGAPAVLKAPAASDPRVIARFWSKVDVGRRTECWEWRAAARALYGYGMFKPRADLKPVRANRFAYELVNGHIPDGQVIRHTCDNPPCCNPDHLVAGSQADNVSDMHARGRRKYESRLTDADIAEIARRCASGEAVANVARHFGISASYASMISNRKRRASRLENGDNNGR